MSKVVIIIILCGTFLLSASHAAESKDQRLKAWDNDFDYKKFSTTAKPFTREPFTWDPTFWRKFTWKPPTWDPPTTDEINNTGNDRHTWLIYFCTIVPFVVVAVLLIKISIHSSNSFIRNTSSSSSSIRNTNSSSSSIRNTNFSWSSIRNTNSSSSSIRNTNSSSSSIRNTSPFRFLIPTTSRRNSQIFSSSSIRNTSSLSSSITNTNSSSSSIRNTNSSSSSIRNETSFRSLIPTTSRRNSQISLGEDTNVPHIVHRPITSYSGVSLATIFNPHERSSTTVSARSGAININGRSESVADKPPGYDAVVLCDLGEIDDKFPRVQTSEPEMPPPSYDFDNVTRY